MCIYFLDVNINFVLSYLGFLSLPLAGILGLNNFSLKSLASERKEALYLDSVKYILRIT